METILIQAETAEDALLIQKFLQEHKIKGRVLSSDDKEDIVLGKLMEETKYDELTNTDEFLNKLRS